MTLNGDPTERKPGTGAADPTPSGKLEPRSGGALQTADECASPSARAAAQARPRQNSSSHSIPPPLQLSHQHGLQRDQAGRDVVQLLHRVDGVLLHGSRPLLLPEKGQRDTEGRRAQQRGAEARAIEVEQAQLEQETASVAAQGGGGEQGPARLRAPRKSASSSPPIAESARAAFRHGAPSRTSPDRPPHLARM